MTYLPRIVDNTLREYLEAFGAVMIEGPKWCGKTTTAERQAISELKLQLPDTRDGYLATAATKPSLLLEGATPRLIDEWKDAPTLWDAVRSAVDARQKVGQFILTGSSSIEKSIILHTGTGRIARIKMAPMSLWESGESTGEISLMDLFNNPGLIIDGRLSKLDIKQLIFASCRGGWPASLSISSARGQLLVAKNYVQSVCANDISTVDGVDRSEKLSREILRAYARNISTRAKKKKMNEREKQMVMEEPTLLLVVTGGPLAYTRPDGVKVIPLACLRD